MIRTPQTFLHAKNSPYSPRVRLMMLILDGHCRGLAYTWYSNASLAEEMGCEVRNLKDLLREMEGLGLILRVIAGQGRKSRLGIVMRKRADPDLPAAETEEELVDAIARLKARREAPTGRKTAPPCGQESSPAKGRKNAPELRSYSREDASSDEAGEGEGSAPRPRREEPTPDTSRPAHPDGEATPAAAPPGPGLTPGQEAFLAKLSPGQRASFDGWSDGRRAETLAMFAGCFDPVIFGELAGQMGPPAAPILGPEAGPFELIAALAGPMGPNYLARCSNALVVALDDRGGSKSWGANLKLCGEVLRRLRPPESLSEPLAKTLAEMERADRGQRDPIENPAAYWQRGVQSWDREHPRPDPS